MCGAFETLSSTSPIVAAGSHLYAGAPHFARDEEAAASAAPPSFAGSVLGAAPLDPLGG